MCVCWPSRINPLNGSVLLGGEGSYKGGVVIRLIPAFNQVVLVTTFLLFFFAVLFVLPASDADLGVGITGLYDVFGSTLCWIIKPLKLLCDTKTCSSIVCHSPEMD